MIFQDYMLLWFVMGEWTSSTGASQNFIVVVFFMRLYIIYLTIHEFNFLKLWNRQPNINDIINIVNKMYEKDGLSKKDVISIVKTFPNQGMYIIPQSLPYFIQTFYIFKII